jgi:hypothetical protein
MAEFPDAPSAGTQTGDLFVETWEGGALDRVFDNVIHSAVPSMIHSAARLQFEGSVYWYGGSGQPKRHYGEEERSSPVGGEFVNPRLDALLRPRADSPLVGRGTGAMGFEPATLVPVPQPGRWTLKRFPGASTEDARSQLVFLEAALAQYGDTRLDAVMVGGQGWPLEKVQVRAVAPEGSREGVLLALLSPSGDVVREWRTLTAPADLGLTLRHVLGPPRGCAPLVPGSLRNRFAD